MKKRIIVILLGVLLIIAGCQGETVEESATGKTFVGGDKGLEISFVKDSPPNVISDNNKEEFDVSLLLKNVGEDTIEQREIIGTLYGINRESFSLPSLSVRNLFTLEGKEKIREKVIQGDEEELTFDNLKYKEDLGENFPVELRVDVCYEYETNALSHLCLKRNPTERKSRDACDVTDENIDVENSGAPVKIRNLEQFGRSDQIKFDFEVAKVGSGEIYEPGTFRNSCSFDEDKENKVEIEITSPARLNIKCSKLDDKNKGVVELIDGKSRTVTCSIDTRGLQEIAFKEIVKIKVRYVYKNSVSTSFVVEDSD